MAAPKQLITERLDREPSIFKGCSLTELTWMTIASGLLLLPISLLGAALFGNMVMGFGVAGILLVATVYIEASIFNRLKVNQPPGYYQQRLHLWLAKHKLVKSPIINRSGYWDIGRF